MLTNITLSAEESLVRKSRKKAQIENTSLNKLFRQWLERYTKQNGSSSDYEQLMKKLSYTRVDRKFTRDELNER
jgi:bacillopeptidase F (M6 metalloprotease family)